MVKARGAEPADLFADGAAGTGDTPQDGPASADFADLAERVRQELRATLARVQAAETLPWPNLTKTYLAEMRFESIAGWLPGEEAEALKAAFGKEMDRLYRAAGEERPERATS